MNRGRSNLDVIKGEPYRGPVGRYLQHSLVDLFASTLGQTGGGQSAEFLLISGVGKSEGTEQADALLARFLASPIVSALPEKRRISLIGLVVQAEAEGADAFDILPVVAIYLRGLALPE